MAARFNELAARARLNVGMVCGTDYFDIWQTEPGACDHAELTDKGPVGQFLRAIKNSEASPAGTVQSSTHWRSGRLFWKTTLRLLRLTNGF